MQARCRSPNKSTHSSVHLAWSSRTCDNNAIINTRAAPLMKNEMGIRFMQNTAQRRCLMKVKSRKSFVRNRIEIRFSLCFAFTCSLNWQLGLSEANFLYEWSVFVSVPKYEKCDLFNQNRLMRGISENSFEKTLISTGRGCLHLHTKIIFTSCMLTICGMLFMNRVSFKYNHLTMELIIRTEKCPKFKSNIFHGLMAYHWIFDF